MKRQRLLKKAYQASALVITLMFIVLLGLEALIVGLVLTRSTGTEAVLRGKNTSVRRASELVLNTLSSAIYSDIVSGNLTAAQMYAKYKRGGTSTMYSTLTSNRYTTTNPESGATDALNIDTAAWIQEYRGYYYHLVGRAKQDDVDLITHKWVLIKPCTYTASGSAVLTTIMSSVNYPGYKSTVIDPITGRVFFGAAADTTYTSTNFYSWLPATGLSTIASGPGIGNRSTFMASDGRVFFGEGDDTQTTTGRFWTWKDGVLSTIKSGLKGAGRGCDTCGQGTSYSFNRSFFDTRSDRVYFGEDVGGLYTWKNGILTTIYNNGDQAIDKLTFGAADEAYFTNNPGDGNWYLYRWTPASGLTTAINLTAAGVPNNPGHDGISGQANGRVWFGEDTGKLHSWHPGTGLSTINGSYTNPFGPNYFQELNTGEVYIGDTGGSYIWKPSSPQTITTIRSGTFPSYSITNGSFFYIVHVIDYVWTPANGLSTLMAWSSGDKGSTVFDPTSNLAYLGETHATSDITVWDTTTGNVTTLVALSVLNVGTDWSTAIDSTGRAYFGQNSNTGKVRAYKQGSGMTTIISTNRSYPGVFSMKSHPVEGVYWGEGSATGNFYYYGPASSNECATRPY